VGKTELEARESCPLRVEPKKEKFLRDTLVKADEVLPKKPPPDFSNRLLSRVN